MRKGQPWVHPSVYASTKKSTYPGSPLIEAVAIRYCGFQIHGLASELKVQTTGEEEKGAQTHALEAPDAKKVNRKWSGEQTFQEMTTMPQLQMKT